MNIHDFAMALSRQYEQQMPCVDLKNEAEFERKHIVDPAWELARQNPEIRVYVHPEGRKDTCRGGCETGVDNFEYRVKGCSICWKNSKIWSVTKAFGTKSNFDLVAIDKRNETLAVEVKWLSHSAAGRRPNSEFQRFVGQCVLASAVHNVVIGVCGFRGRTNEFHENERELLSVLKKIGIILIPLYANISPAPL